MGSRLPRLETGRLSMRVHRAADFEEYAAMWGEAAVVRYIGGGQPASRQVIWARMLRQVGHWQLFGFGYWLARDKDSGRLVGEVGFANFQRETEPSLGDAPEAGWVLASWAHGKGYATEALGAALRWSDDNLGPRSVCMVHPDNDRSLRLADAHGFRETHRTTYHGEEQIVLERVAAAA